MNLQQFIPTSLLPIEDLQTVRDAACRAEPKPQLRHVLKASMKLITIKIQDPQFLEELSQEIQAEAQVQGSESHKNHIRYTPKDNL